jgi:hypothetical protein
MNVIDKMQETELEDANVWEVFKGLEGIWQIERELKGYGNMMDGKMLGTASFRKLQNNNAPYYYYYQEKGILQLSAGNQFRVHRKYAYSYAEETIHVHYWDDINRHQGPLLHTLYFAQVQKKKSWPLYADGKYLCKRDTYKAHYEFINNNRFKLSYNILGPHKNYLIKTNFCRLGQLIK